MMIERVDVFHVAMPLIYPFRTAFGNDATIESVLVRMTAGGNVGWGEAAPWRDPAYSAEYAAGAFEMVRRFLAPRLVGQRVETGAQLQDLLRPIKGNYFAKATLDLAWWDLHARGRGEQLWKTLGGRGPTVAVGADFGVMESIDSLLAEIQAAVSEGAERIKLKYRPGWDLDMISAVRAAFPDAVIHVDCNSAYTLADLPMLRQLDRFQLAMIEQPLMHNDLLDHAALQRQIDTPICLDESITSVDKARKAIELKACRWVNLKTGRLGGITNAVAVHDVCRDAGIPCWIGSMAESAVGAGHNIAMASLPNIAYPSDIFPTSRFYERDLARPAMVFSGPSRITAADGPGIGAVPDDGELAKATVQHATIELPQKPAVGHS